MRSVMRALLLAALLAGLAAAADDNPVKRCKNHYILRQLGCIIDEAPSGWSEAAPLRTYHGAHTATLLQDGRVLVAGDTGLPELNAEIYDPATGAWTLTSPMSKDRPHNVAVLLADGRVLVLGGEVAPWTPQNWFNYDATAEVFDPRAPGEGASMRGPRRGGLGRVGESFASARARRRGLGRSEISAETSFVYSVGSVFRV